MITRRYFCEQILRQVYGGWITDDNTITMNLVNSYVNEAIASVAKQNYIENGQLDGIAYVNNSFYTTFKNLTITEDENFLFKIELPKIPLGIGRNEGIASVQFKDTDKNISYECALANMSQVSYLNSARAIPNKPIAWNEENDIFIRSVISLTPFKGLVRMVSGSASDDLDSTLSLPADYIPKVREYVVNQLIRERQQPTDTANDGINKV